MAADGERARPFGSVRSELGTLFFYGKFSKTTSWLRACCLHGIEHWIHIVLIVGMAMRPQGLSYMTVHGRSGCCVVLVMSDLWNSLSHNIDLKNWMDCKNFGQGMGVQKEPTGPIFLGHIEYNLVLVVHISICRWGNLIRFCNWFFHRFGSGKWRE